MTLATPRRNCDSTGINATLSSPISPDGRPEPGTAHDVVVSACPQDIVPITGAARSPTSVSFVLEPS